jgi:hypothetical protein
VGLAYHLPLRDGLEPGLEGKIVKDRLQKCAVEGRAGVKRRYDHAVCIVDWTEASVPLSLG